MPKCCADQWGPHQLMTATRALYIGKSAPTPSHDGLASIQKPLYRLYSKNDCQRAITDQDATLYVLTSGILAMSVNELDEDIWLPIQDLQWCMAVRPVLNPGTCEACFVPVDSPEAARGMEYLPVFAAVVKRGKGLKISDCYGFICPSAEIAQLLVQQCMRAYATPLGWATDKPTLKQLGLEQPKPRSDYECYVDDNKDDCPPEFYEKPSLKGYYYAPRADLVQKFKIKNENECECVEPFPCDEPAVAYVPVMGVPCKKEKKKEKKSKRIEESSMSQWVPNGQGGYGPVEEVTVDVFQQGGPSTAVWDFGQPVTGGFAPMGDGVYSRRFP